MAKPTNQDLLSELSTLRLLFRMALTSDEASKGRRASMTVEESVKFVGKYFDLIESNARMALKAEKES